MTLSCRRMTNNVMIYGYQNVCFSRKELGPRALTKKYIADKMLNDFICSDL